MEQKRPLISVIVPVYNVGGYIQGCLDALLAQTYPNMEIILVDDASTDGSGAACDGYASRNPQIYVIHLPRNQGPSAARNEGVRRAQGAFISFVDADDRVEPDLLEKLYYCLVKSRAEISACGADGIRLKTGPAAAYSRAEAGLRHR